MQIWMQLQKDEQQQLLKYASISEQKYYMRSVCDRVLSRRHTLCLICLPEESKDMTGTFQTLLVSREQKDNKLLQGLLANTTPFDRVVQ